MQSLYFGALELDPDARAEFLSAECGDDDELYTEVESLLNAKSTGLLDGLAIDSFQKVAEAPGQQEMDGEHIGPYRIVRRIGTGGMGTVFLAERADGQFEQTVALKLVKRGMDTDAVINRFQSERQILARLEHPNIGRLLDGGVHVDGRPYFALEYIAGEPITEYCDARALSVPDRLRLFEDVCRAVAYAHRNLVVHRDLKPSNILVRDDPTGQGQGQGAVKSVVKLLDFGIAKLLVDNADDLLTRTGERVLTPAYAAPEQIRGEPITTATDVYGLGIVLFELLTGRRPSDPGSRGTAGLGSSMRSAITADPDRPSSVATRPRQQSAYHPDTVAAEDIARLRSTTPDRLRRILRGDIDTIVMMALRDQPDRRYASAGDFLADLQAYRYDKPVAARPESASYRLGKYVKRHRVGVSATVLVALIGSLLIGFYTVRLATERDRAQLESVKSEQISSFLSGLFAISNPRESGGEEITARDLLDRGAQRIDDELADQPEVRAQMMHLIGEVYTSLGSYEEAEAILGETLGLRREIGDSDQSGVASTLVAIGLLYEQQGRYIEAAATQQEAVDILRDGQSTKPLALADALHGLSFLKLRLAQFDDAERLIHEALEIKYGVLGDDDPSVAYSLNILADVYTFQKRFDEAEAIHLRALDIRRRHLGNAHLDVASSLHNLGATLRDAKRYAESESYYREALAVWRRYYGYDHQERANTLSQLAYVVGMQGRFDESDSLQSVAMEIALGSVGPDHPKVAAMQIRRGDVLAVSGRIKLAEASYRFGIATQRRMLGDAHPTVTRWQIGLGVLVAKQGRLEEGLALIRESSDRCGSPERGGFDGCAVMVEEALAGLPKR